MLFLVCLLCVSGSLGISELDHMKQDLREELKQEIREELLKEFGEKIRSDVTKEVGKQLKLVSPVAFTAAPSANQGVGNGVPIAFDNVYTNVGGHFAPPHYFTCPLSGYYMFTYGLLGTHGLSVAARLKVGEVTTGPTIYSLDAGGIGTATVFVHCAAGQAVSVVSSGTSYPFGGNHGVFSGMLMYM